MWCGSEENERYSANSRIKYHKAIRNNGFVRWHACIFSFFHHSLCTSFNNLRQTTVILLLIYFLFHRLTNSSLCYTGILLVIILPIKYILRDIFQTLLKSNVDLLHSILHYIFFLFCICCFFLHIISHAVSIERKKNCTLIVNVWCKLWNVHSTKIIWWDAKARARTKS